MLEVEAGDDVSSVEDRESGVDRIWGVAQGDDPCGEVSGFGV